MSIASENMGPFEDLRGKREPLRAEDLPEESSPPGEERFLKEHAKVEPTEKSIFSGEEIRAAKEAAQETPKPEKKYTAEEMRAMNQAFDEVVNEREGYKDGDAIVFTPEENKSFKQRMEAYILNDAIDKVKEAFENRSLNETGIKLYVNETGGLVSPNELQSGQPGGVFEIDFKAGSENPREGRIVGYIDNAESTAAENNDSLAEIKKEVPAPVHEEYRQEVETLIEAALIFFRDRHTAGYKKEEE